MNTDDLWQQIVAAPGDDTLKTQYVQALAQEGDRRAEIFRLVAELEKFPSYYVQHEGLARQYESSLAEWRADFDVPAKTWQAEVTFVKGWPIEITIAAREFRKRAAEIVKILPLRHLNLPAASEAPAVFDVAQFDQIASLNGSHQRWSDEAIQALAASTHLNSLRWLDLSHTELEEAQVEMLAASPRLRDVEHLDLSNNPCRDPVDAAAGYGTDGNYGFIIPDSIWLPEFGKELEARHGRIGWLHALDNFMEKHPPARYQF